MDFIKLDLEGAEPLAVEGAQELLRKFSPSIYIEISPNFMKNFHWNGSSFLKLLSECGYDTLIGFLDSVNPPQLLDYRTFDNKDLVGYNLVCLNSAKHVFEWRALKKLV